MKKIIIALFLITLVSCSKSIDRQSTQRFFFSSASDASTAPIQGARTTCDVINFKGNDTKLVSIMLRTDNGYIVQFGYQRVNNATSPVLNVSREDTLKGLTVALIYPPQIIFGQKQTFSIYNVPGTTKWRTAIDGVDRYELELSTQYGSGAKIFVDTGPVDAVNRFPIINFYPALETYVNGNWLQVQSAYASSADFGIEGNLQNVSVRLNELNIGSGITIIPIGTVLWNNN